MSAHILSIAYPFAPVGGRAVGGAEQVLTTLEQRLGARGFRSTIVACGGSSAAGRLMETALPAGMITPEIRERVTRDHQLSIDRALESGVDLVHMHGIDFSSYRLPATMPVLVTLHMPPSWYPNEVWHLPSNYQLQCVSESQRRACPPEHRMSLPVVENGVTLPVSPGKRKKREFALLLSRICPEKNMHAGLAAARRAGVKALVAGEVFPYEEHLRYMAEDLQPLLSSRARLLGPVTGERKQRLLEAARCLLLPTLAPETSSLTAMEALASGTPVVAYRSGALPEIIEGGVTGFLVANEQEMAEAIGRVHEIDPHACRAAAETRFDAERMVDDYLQLYAQMLAARRAA